MLIAVEEAVTLGLEIETGAGELVLVPAVLILWMSREEPPHGGLAGEHSTILTDSVFGHYAPQGSLSKGCDLANIAAGKTRSG